MRKSTLLVIVFIFFLSGCSLPWFKTPIEIIEHEAPSLSIDNSFMSSRDCFNSVSCLPEAILQTDPPIDALSMPQNDLAGLTPQVPLAIAVTRSAFQLDETNFVYSRHCLESHYYRYVVFTEGGFKLLSTRNDLAEFYAPIDSPEEAYSFAIAATGYKPLFNLGEQNGLVFENAKIEETYSQNTQGEYRVHLFESSFCGCGPHFTRSIDVIVHFDGTLTISDPVTEFHDPEMDNVCGD